MKGQRISGAITVFFSLILLLIIVLVVTSAEGARIGACRNLAEQMVRISGKSLLSAYDRPLFEHYHIFGRYLPNGTESGRAELCEELEMYLSMNSSGKTWIDFTYEDANVEDMTSLLQDGGEGYFNQAIQYAKYQDAVMAAELLTKNAELMKRNEKNGIAIQRAMEATMPLQQAELTLCNLFGCVDGFATDETSGLVANSSGKLKTVFFSAKMIVPGGVTAGNLFAGAPELFEERKAYYYDPEEIIKLLKQTLEQKRDYHSEAKEYGQLIEAVETGEIAAKDAAKEIGYELQKSEADEEEEVLTELQQREESCKLSESAAAANYQSILSDYELAVVNMLACSEKGQQLIVQLKTEKQVARTALSSFQTELTGYEGEIDEGVYSGLKQQTDSLLRKTGRDNEIGILGNISKMETTLRDNAVILRKIQQQIGSLKQAGMDEPENYYPLLELVRQQSALLKTDELWFTYEQIRFPEEKDGFSGFIKKLAKNGLLEILVEDTAKLSEGSMDIECRVSDSVQQNGLSFSLTNLFQSGSSLLTDQQAAWENSMSGAEALADKLLFLTYLANHFDCYDAENATKYLSDSATDQEGLVYQLEYILGGNDSDRANLASTATKIFMVRYAMNLGMLFSSSAAMEKVRATATAIVGFTGIGALVAAMEFVILMLWAAECAMTETSALLMGKSVDFITTAAKCAVEYEEILNITKSKIIGKAQNYGSNAGGILNSYRDYLYLFLALQKKELQVLRSMDIIQQMMRIKYYDDFSMNTCICALKVSVKVLCSYRFLPSVGISGNGLNSKEIYFEFSY